MMTTVAAGPPATVIGTAETDKIRILSEGRAGFLPTGDFGPGQRIPPKRTCLLGVYWALQHAILRGGMSGVGGKPDLALLERQPESKHAAFARVAQADLEQLQQDVDALEKKIADLPDAPVAKEDEGPAPPSSAR